MSLQKTWGNIHLTALGAMMLSFSARRLRRQRRTKRRAARAGRQRR